MRAATAVDTREIDTATHIVIAPQRLGSAGEGLLRGARVDASYWRNVRALEQADYIRRLQPESESLEKAKQRAREKQRAADLADRERQLGDQAAVTAASVAEAEARVRECEAAAAELPKARRALSEATFQAANIARARRGARGADRAGRVMASIIALGLDVLEASPDPLADGEMLDCPKPLNVTGLSETDVIRLAALAGRHQLTDGQAIRLVIGTGLRWAQAARA